MNNKGQQGFTLIELIIVIVILGVLAATALPKFIDLGKDARIAALEGALGAMNSAIAMTHAKALISGSLSADVTVEGATVKMSNGYPTKATDGIDAAMNVSGDLSIASGVITIAGATTSATCQVVYTAATTSAPASATLTTTGC